MEEAEGRTAGGRPARAGIVDLGSSTATLALFEAGPPGFVHRTEQVGYALGLVRALDDDGALRRQAVGRIVDSVREFARRAEAFGVDHVGAYATSAIRDAVNREEVAAAVTRQTGVELVVLPGEEEGRIAAVSAIATLPLEEGVVLDLGGGSLQLARVRGRRIREVVSLPLGALRMADAWLGGDPPTGPEIVALRTHATERLAAVPWLAGAGPTVIGVGGTLRALAKLHRRARGWPISHPHGYPLHADDLLAAVDVLGRMPRAARAEVPGLPAHRVDSAVAGAVVAWAALRAAGAEAVRLSAYGLREGFAIEALHGGAPPADVRAAGLAGRFPCPDERSRDAAHRAVDALAEVALAVEPTERAGLTLAAWVASSDAHDPRRLLREPVPGHTQEEVLCAARLLRLVEDEPPDRLEPLLRRALAA